MAVNNDFRKSFEDNIDMLKAALRADENFDVIIKTIKFSDRQATMFCIDGFMKDEVLEKMFEFFTTIPAKDMQYIKTTKDLLDNFVTYIESNVETSLEKVVTLVLSGALVMVVDGFTEAIIIDARTYPARNVQEPESDKVLRGSHEGFVETLIFNTALIRRKIRDPRLTMQLHQVGSKSRTDITVCYIDGIADQKMVDRIASKIDSIEVGSLAMSQESLRECLIPSQPLNPFPKVRYTERPDAAAACLCDGNILVLCDGSPSVMIVPTGIFDFSQDINDFYFPPLVGTFLRYVRGSVFFLSMILTPLWLVLMKNADKLPHWLDFILVEEPNSVRLFVQLMIVEFVIDVLKLASLNTPGALSNSFSVVGALILGEFAVSSGWFVPEVVLFMAFTAISNFTQPSFEMGYAIKFSRVLLLILSEFLNYWGLIIGMVIIALVVCFTKTVNGYTYLYPLYPFNKKALISLLVRKSIRSSLKQTDNAQ